MIELFETNWDATFVDLDATGGLTVPNKIYNIDEMTAHAIAIGQRSDFDACAVRFAGSRGFKTIGIGAPLILDRPQAGPIEVSSFPYNLSTDLVATNYNYPGALSLEIYNHIPAWIHDRRRGPSGCQWVENGESYNGSPGWEHSKITSTGENHWFTIPTFGRRRVYLWFSGQIRNTGSNDDLMVRASALSIAGRETSWATWMRAPVWPDPNDATAFETISGAAASGGYSVNKAVIDVEGWERLRIFAKKATNTSTETYAFRWLAVD